MKFQLLLVVFTLTAFIDELEAISAIRINELTGIHPLLNFLTGRNPQYRLSNWGGNFQFSTKNIQYPRSTAEVQNLVQNSYSNMRALGTRHSFSKIADSDEMLISTNHMNQILGLNATVPSLTVEAGMLYTDLAPFLEVMGFALPNLATLAEISVAGAAQTGAHGSGVTNGNLATQIIGVKIVLANGTIATYTQGQNELKAIALGLGAFGIITEVTLKIEPTFQLAQHVFLNMSMTDFVANFDAVTSAAHTVQFFLDYSIPNVINSVFVNAKVSDANSTTVASAPTFYGATKATQQMTPIAALPTTYIVHQLGVPGPWHERLVDYRLGLSGYNGEEIQSEYFLPWANATAAILALNSLGPQIYPIVYTALFRTIAADDLWLSPEYNQKSLAIHFTWKPDLDAILAILPLVEAKLIPFGAVPHWGKLFTQQPSTFLPRYQKLQDFKNLANQLDPQRKFRNDFLNKNVFVNL